MVSKEELILRGSSKIMKRQAEAEIPTEWGYFNMCAYAEDDVEKMPHLALVHESFNGEGPIYVRIHSECLTGDIFGSKRCDCGEQLVESLKIASEKGGVVIYLRQEGRGIGLINKLKAYNLQDEGLNTVDANVHLGHEVDAREYQVAVEILQDLGISKINLMTNNPLKIQALDESPIEVVSRIPIIIKAQEENYNYLKTKKDLMGHLLTPKD